MTAEANQLIAYLAAAERIVIFSGAGISTASGIPDFRGPEGVWKTRSPIYYQDFMASEAARLAYWAQKAEDWKSYKAARPNTVHQAVQQLEEAGKLRLCITQNIDGLHAAAGVSARRLVELHGTNRMVECQHCHERRDADSAYRAFRQHPAEAPRCKCGGYLKPATISFGQSLRPEDLEKAQTGVFDTDLVIALGSTLSVQPAASLTLLAARRGVPYVVINQGLTEHDGHPLVSLRLEGDVIDHFPPAVAAALAMSG